MKKLFFTIFLMLLCLVFLFLSLVYLKNINTYILMGIVAIELFTFLVLGARLLTQVTCFSMPESQNNEVRTTDGDAN